MIRICLAVVLLVGNASWLAAQFKPEYMEEEVGLRPIRRFKQSQQPKEQPLPFQLTFESSFHQKDTDRTTSHPSNRETWTEFVQVRQANLPTTISQHIVVETNYIGITKRRSSSTEHRPWFACIASRYPCNGQENQTVYYQLVREPDALRPHYEGCITYAPNITARAKTIEALEAKLLEMYCDYITQMVEEDLQPPVATPPEKKPVFTIADYLPLYDIIHEPSFIRPYYVAAFSLRPNIKAVGVNIDQLETSLLETYSKHLEEVAIGIRKIEGTAVMPTRSVNEGTSRDR